MSRELKMGQNSVEVPQNDQILEAHHLNKRFCNGCSLYLLCSWSLNDFDDFPRS